MPKLVLSFFSDHCTLAFLMGILFFSYPGLAIAGYQPIAETLSLDAKRAAAKKADQEGLQLERQGTAESRRQAIDKWQTVLKLWQQIGDTNNEAKTLYNIGLVYSDLGEKHKALELLKQALPLMQKVGNKEGEARIFSQIGRVYNLLGEEYEALTFLNQALILIQKINNKKDEATALNNIGKIYSHLGDKQKALEYYHQALPLRRAAGDKRGEAITINNIGLVYSYLGEKKKALEYYHQALPLMQQTNNQDGEAATLNYIGRVYSYLGEKQKALAFFEKALPLTKQTGNRGSEAATLNNIALTYSNLGNNSKALEYYQQALFLREAVSDISGKAITLTGMGKVYANLGDDNKAMAYYQQALPLRQAVGDKEGEANTLFNIADLERDRGNLQAALIQIEAAIQIIEDLRTNIASKLLRAFYFATQHKVYAFYIDLLMQLHKQQPAKGYDAIALQASESTRARSLLELLAEAKVDIRQGVDPNLLAAESNLRKKFDAVEQQRLDLLNSQHTQKQIQLIETEIAALIDQYRELKAKIRTSSPRYAALTQPQPLKLTEIQQQVLDKDTLLLQYFLGEKRSYLWVISKTNISSYELPNRTQIEAAAQKFSVALTAPSQRNNFVQIAKAATPLTQMLLPPAATISQHKRLVIVSDGALQYLPFGALTTSSNYEPLLLKHEIISLPSASTLAIIRREHQGRKLPPKKLAVIADPVFSQSDERLTVKKTPLSQLSPTNNINTLALNRSVNNYSVKFDRLRFTRKEADKILELVPEDQRLQVLGFAANRDFVTSNQLSQYQIVHFATHGIINNQRPELSGVVLSLFDEQGKPQNGFLRLLDFYNLYLPVELVVLSACQTGWGENIRGEGLVGLTTAFMYAGSPRVIMSLWSVDDEGTSILMQKFYQKMLKENLKPASALRQSQIEMWQEQKWNSPFYWAAFMLQGEWR
ncbi:CHAT domain-containing protein [Anabaena cylindrica FACHB-243]|uniref:Tetratricopeptide TPR_1 repeat-containing protein n=1 Tax=Anabaena cylindrica (strain ATCC 27899 / PCC 7122) TaxID=272123 RepID=K9ZE44_ANACC|nr:MULTISPECIES: CHAT domain-containing tetratricopeptide repeat protein [Anabaena]AFZ56635.1 Tetratricopeptide TPR_1 repeat-containing protein [Anabaena cylindrica PCC 7122]MBD2416193.1 CHAT domain-containing protein [Anabaena cylindrica FACHB-243]MBY5284785.1 CHAT domain-containing protein [Anabaena sp. CCAP 1446/1C]MBY5309121.1 CHAT domain-containing protein [Anabaena sp. CCAP 1446/1C]MCM2408928.1 CHAT domain-containing protein [Anabaena sp. CCAP 1446/1C]